MSSDPKKIITTDTGVLKATNVEVSINEGKKIIEMLDFSLKCLSSGGVGLAAPQIKINKRVAIIRYKHEFVDLINPIVIEKNRGFINYNEGCLSVPNRVVNTFRFKDVLIRDSLHPNGIVLIGMIAVIALHEIDHLNGILITDIGIKKKIGRNDPCPCGKTKGNGNVKFKHCHGK
jgi:peptide deformylase